MIKILSGLFVCLLGAMLSLAFAPYDLYPLAILMPAALLWIWLKQTPLRALLTGLLFGIGYFGFGVYWIYISVHEFGGLPPIAAIGATAFVVLFLSTFIAMTGYSFRKKFSTSHALPTLLGFPALWVIGEWMRSWILTGFPWLYVGYSQHHTPLAGYAPLLSVYGVSLASLLTSALLVIGIQKFKAADYKKMYFCALGMCFIWVTGGLLSIIEWTKPIKNTVTVNLVQGNIPQAIKWSSDHVQKSLDVYQELSEPLLKKGSLIVWPEAAIPMSLSSAAEYIQELDDKATAAGAHIILGVPIKAKNQSGYYNALVTLGDSKQVYLKRKLVPYGEYIPFAKQFAELFSFMDIPMANFVQGNHIQPPIKLGDLIIQSSICYEIAYPELSNFRDSKVNLLLTVTNDAWFGDSPAQAQHLEIAQMRSIELARPLLFATNDGQTAIIGPKGQILETIPPHKTMVLTSRIQPVSGQTPWMRFGSDPMILILLFMLVTAAIITRKQNKKG